MVEETLVDATAKRLVLAICAGVNPIKARAGTMIIPPPTPSSEPRAPAPRPMAINSTIAVNWSNNDVALDASICIILGAKKLSADQFKIVQGRQTFYCRIQLLAQSIRYLRFPKYRESLVRICTAAPCPVSSPSCRSAVHVVLLSPVIVKRSSIKLRVIMVGFGMVGQSFAKLLLSRSADLYSEHGLKPRIVACIDNKGFAISPAGLDLRRLLEAKKSNHTVAAYDKRSTGFDPLQVIESVEAEVVLECTPTNLSSGEPGISHIIAAMKTAKHVISVNKGPLALAFPSLIELANYNGVMIRFSGTVGGGTPILEFAKRCLKGDRIVSFYGILNGTTNYVLSRMQEGLTYETALADAKRAGIAESNPSLDVDGFDAAAKLVIMANWVMGMKVTMKDVDRTGISNVQASDVARASGRGNAIKLLAKCDSKTLNVAPTEISKMDPICVNGTLNAVTFSSEHSGQQTIIGRGAGGMETASAILRDLIEIRDTIFER